MEDTLTFSPKSFVQRCAYFIVSQRWINESESRTAHIITVPPVLQVLVLKVRADSRCSLLLLSRLNASPTLRPAQCASPRTLCVMVISLRSSTHAHRKWQLSRAADAPVRAALRPLLTFSVCPWQKTKWLTVSRPHAELLVLMSTCPSREVGKPEL